MDRRVFLAGSVALLARQALGGDHHVHDHVHANGELLHSTATHQFHAKAHRKIEGVTATHKQSGKKEDHHKKFKKRGKPLAGLAPDGTVHHVVVDHEAAGLSGDPAQVVIYVGYAFVYTVTIVFWWPAVLVDGGDQGSEDYAGQ